MKTFTYNSKTEMIDDMESKGLSLDDEGGIVAPDGVIALLKENPDGSVVLKYLEPS